MSDEEQTVYGVVESFEGLKVVELQAKLVDDVWVIRRKRGHSVWIDQAPKDKLYPTREAAEARRNEILAGK